MTISYQQPCKLTQAAAPARIDELVRDNDAAIEARVQVLASAIAAESGSPQPDFALVDCLHQQVVDLRTIQGNFRHFVLGAPSLAARQQSSSTNVSDSAVRLSRCLASGQVHANCQRPASQRHRSVWWLMPTLAHISAAPCYRSPAAGRGAGRGGQQPRPALQRAAQPCRPGHPCEPHHEFSPESRGAWLPITCLTCETFQTSPEQRHCSVGICS